MFYSEIKEIERIPRRVYIDVTNVCNLKCLMCPQGYGKIKNKGFMSKDLFLKILNDLAGLKPKPKVAFHLIGEPFLHPDIFEFIGLANDKGLFTFLHTNGFLLDGESCKRIVGCGLKEITFSFDGEDRERYNRLRKGSDWSKVANNIKYMLKLAGHPRIIVEVLKFRGKDKDLEIGEDFKKLFLGAHFYSYFASDWRGTLDSKELKEERDPQSITACKSPFQDMAIGWDGTVKLCTLDYNSEVPLGNLKDATVMDLWLGEKKRDFLDKISNLKYSSIVICRKCNAPYYSHKKEHKWITI